MVEMSKVRRELIDSWIKANKPNGIDKLAYAAGIPSGSLMHIRQGRGLVNPYARARLAAALGVSESELSVPVRAGKDSRAS
jgi:hypothetical protein